MMRTKSINWYQQRILKILCRSTVRDFHDLALRVFKNEIYSLENEDNYDIALVKMIVEKEIVKDTTDNQITLLAA